MKQELYQCNWCGLRVRNGLDIALHVTTTHYHQDMGMAPKESKRILKRTIPFLLVPEYYQEVLMLSVN